MIVQNGMEWNGTEQSRVEYNTIEWSQNGIENEWKMELNGK